MKKICFFSGDITRSGGTERVGIMIANGLKEKGFDIIFVSLEERAQCPFFSVDKRISRYTLKKYDKNSFFVLVNRLLKIIKSNDIDIIIDIDGILDIYSLPCKLFSKVKVISWEHFNFYQTLGNKLRRPIRKLSGRYADKIITLTEKDMNYYKNNLNLKSEIEYIYNPISDDNIYDHELNTKTIISVGRLTYQKGFDMLVEVAKKVLSTHSDWRWIILGEGEDRELLENKIKEYGLENKLILKGNVKNVNDYYKKSSFFVMTSRFEGLPMTLLEAKKYRLPIISFDCKTGPSELIIDGINGYLIDEFDLLKLEDMINKLIDNPKILQEFTKNSIEGLEKFSYNKIINKWERILENF